MGSTYSQAVRPREDHRRYLHFFSKPTFRFILFRGDRDRTLNFGNKLINFIRIYLERTWVLSGGWVILITLPTASSITIITSFTSHFYTSLILLYSWFLESSGTFEAKAENLLNSSTLF